MLSVQHVSKSYAGTRALHDVSIEVGSGEVVGLIGENGAGKSTLMRVLGGTVRQDAGTVSIDGGVVQSNSSREAAAHGIAMVFQEQSLLLNLSVAENIYLGQEQEFSRFRLIDWRRLNAAAKRQLDKVGVDLDPRTRAAELSFAARQMVELAKALALEEQRRGQLVILLDEPTSVLEQKEIDVLFERVRALRSRASFLFVSHRLDEVLAISDRVYVMKDGEVVAEREAASASVEELHALMVGRDLHTGYYREHRQRPDLGAAVLEARGLSVAGAFADVDLALHAGEVLGIAGVIGSGREELSRSLFGFMPPSAGTLRVNGQDVRFDGPHAAVEHGLGYIPRERRVEGLVMYFPMTANITLANLDAVTSRGCIDHRRERALAVDWVERLRIRPPKTSMACRNLSGGNQQKVVLAKWMTAGARILILDHPTRGLDVGAKEEVYDVIRDLSDAGVAIILLSDTLEETIGLSHNILVMRDGKITASFEAPGAAKPPQVDIVRHMV